MSQAVLVRASLVAVLSVVLIGCGKVVSDEGIDSGALDAPGDGQADNDASCIPATEVCNHLDDDCDNSTDEGFDFQNDRTNCGDCNVTCGPLQACRGSCVALGSITFDESHVNFTNYPTFRSQLTTAGYTVRSNTAPFTAASLQAVQVLILPIFSSSTAYTTAELDAIEQAVRGGMGLLLATDITAHHVQAEPIANRFGVTFGADIAITTMTIATHPVTSGVTALVRDGSAAAIQFPGGDSSYLLQASGFGFMSATPDGGQFTVLGRVIVITDINVFADNFVGGGNPMADPNNQSLGANAIAWLAGTL